MKSHLGARLDKREKVFLMRLTSIVASVLIVSFVLSQTVLSGPAADIRKPTVTSKTGFPEDTRPTGIDSSAIHGQWFENENGAHAASPYEFYDNTQETGGGSAGGYYKKCQPCGWASRPPDLPTGHCDCWPSESSNWKS